jgi:hypothetical protein
MSARNGDKSRLGRQRKRKIERRVVLRGLRLAKPAADVQAVTQAEPAAPVARE